MTTKLNEKWTKAGNEILNKFQNNSSMEKLDKKIRYMEDDIVDIKQEIDSIQIAYEDDIYPKINCLKKCPSRSARGSKRRRKIKRRKKTKRRKTMYSK